MTVSTPKSERTKASAVLSRLISGITVIGVAAAAAVTSVNSDNKGVGIAAWVAVAVVGASTMIAASKSPQIWKKKEPTP